MNRRHHRHHRHLYPTLASPATIMTMTLTLVYRIQVHKQQ
jgi:hypothetical protein